MEAVLFIGIQATGKSGFYKERFYRTHVRVNNDMLKTRHRAELIVKACLEGKTPFVVDNMNLTRADRAGCIALAKSAGFSVVGYFFETQVADALRRNRERGEGERVSVPGIFGANKRLEIPAKAEGFDQLFVVRLNEPQGFTVEEWKE